MNRQGYVYLLKALHDPSLFKIGRTKNPKNRRETFEVKLPFAIEYECLIQTEDMFSLEKFIHLQFANKRIAGEWFRLETEDVVRFQSQSWDLLLPGVEMVKPTLQDQLICNKCELFMSIVKRVTGAESLDALPGLLQGWKADDLKAHTAFIVQEFSEQLRVVFGYRTDKNASEENGIGVFRWLLSRFGMVLSAKQSRIGNGERCYFYSIDLTAWRILMSDAQAGLAALKANAKHKQLAPNIEELITYCHERHLLSFDKEF